MTKGARIVYSEAERKWLADNYRMVLGDYHAAFVATFNRPDVSTDNLRSLRVRMGWKVGRDPGRYKGRLTLVSLAEAEWLRSNCMMPGDQYCAAFHAAFPVSKATDKQIRALRKRQGWKTGRTGRFEKGSVPWTKGKKLPFNANSAKTQFKKGSRSGIAVEIYKPIGAERLSGSGYLERKIHDGMPLQSRWRAVHLLNWEAINGPIPKGHALKCLNGNRLNTDVSNWELVPRELLPRLNGKSGRNYDTAPAEIKPTIMAVAKLEHAVRAKARKAR
jgi:hypothetical protein